MMKKNIVLLAYFAAIILCSLWVPYMGSMMDPARASFDVHWILSSFVFFAFFFLPFIVLTLYAYQKEKPLLESFLEGLAIWIYIFGLPLFALSSLNTVFEGTFVRTTFMFFILHVGIGVYLVRYFSLAKNQIVPALILPGFWNLYLLTYGIYTKKTDE